MHYLHVKPLSERELEVLQWLAAGASDREISQGLYITQSTVRRHVHNILGKLNVGSRTQAALRAIKLGLAPHPKLLPPIQGTEPGMTPRWLSLAIGPQPLTVGKVES